MAHQSGSRFSQPQLDALVISTQGGLNVSEALWLDASLYSVLIGAAVQWLLSKHERPNFELCERWEA